MNKLEEHVLESKIAVNLHYDIVRDDVDKWVDAFAVEFAKRILTEAAEIAYYMEDQNELNIGDEILKYFEINLEK